MVDWSVAVMVVMLVVEKVVWMAEKMAVKLVAPMVVMMVAEKAVMMVDQTVYLWETPLESDLT